MSEHSNKLLIFLTGCINPEGMKHTKLQNPYEREKQYIEAIKFYLDNTAANILFIENSGRDISNYFIREIQSKRLEILTFEGNNYNKNLGKGYGEMRIIEYALNKSELLVKSDFIFKITGRYKVLNINSFEADYKNNCSFDLLVDLSKDLNYSDSRFLGCKGSFFSKYLIKYSTKINDSQNYFFEHALCKATLEAIINNFKYSPLKYKPRYSGIYGTDSTKYDDSWIHWFPRNIKYRLRYMLSN